MQPSKNKMREALVVLAIRHIVFFYFCAGFELISIEDCWGLLIEIHLHWQLTVQPVEIYFYQ